MASGVPFLEVPAGFAPDDWEEKSPPPVFSEAFLYPAVGRDDARFILGVAEEYAHLVEALGPAAVRAVLDVKPALVNRLGTGAKIIKWLEDARDFSQLDRERRLPSQVIVDSEMMHEIWKGLHAEYRQLFEPEVTMDRGRLALYNRLTDALGDWERGEREKERARAPEKLAAKAKKAAQADLRLAVRRAERELEAAIKKEAGHPWYLTDEKTPTVADALAALGDAKRALTAHVIEVERAEKEEAAGAR